MELFIQILGWSGTGIVLLAYYLISAKKLSPSSSIYQIMNLVGVIGVGASVYHQHAWSALVLQIVWGLIALSTFLQVKIKTAQ